MIALHVASFLFVIVEMKNVLQTQRVSPCSPGELSLIRFSSTKYPGNESYKATLPYMN